MVITNGKQKQLLKLGENIAKDLVLNVTNEIREEEFFTRFASLILSLAGCEHQVDLIKQGFKSVINSSVESEEFNSFLNELYLEECCWALTLV